MRTLKKLFCGGLFILLFFPVNFGLAEQSPDVTVSGHQRDTSVSFFGFSSPGSFITFYDNGNVVGTDIANSSGGFSKHLSAQVPNTHSFGISSEDTSSRTSPTYGFVLSLLANSETDVSNIILPPTIDVSVGSGVDIFGLAPPDSQVTIFVHSDPITQPTNSATDGSWSHNFTSLVTGSHTAYAMVTRSGGLQSTNSDTVNFDISCGVADLDCNGVVDLVDFSILMYYWGATSGVADINADGIVDLTDFSIMMFYWTG